MAKEQDDAEAIFNRANIALARSRVLIQSWLGPPSVTELTQGKTEEELDAEDHELFKAEPETLGVGAKAPEDDLETLNVRRKNDKLLEQLLGKQAAKSHKASKARINVDQKPIVKTAAGRKGVADDEDDEDGRASMLATRSSKRRKAPAPSAESTGAEAKNRVLDDADDEERAMQTTRKAKSSRRGKSYLDQLLEDKAKRKHKG